MPANLFVLWYGLTSFITPPVCIAIYVACSISGSTTWKTAFAAMRLGIVAYIIPFMFAYNPALLLVGPVSDVVRACITALIGVVALSGATMGLLFRAMTPVERILLGGAGIALIFPGIVTDYIGIPLAIIICAWNYFTRKRESASPTKGDIPDTVMAHSGPGGKSELD